MPLHVGSPLNNTKIMNQVGLDAKTYDRYKGAIINTFIVYEVKPWAKQTHREKRFIKASKIYFNDTNFMCYLTRRDMREIYKNDRATMGHLFENFIASEVMKNASSIADIEVSYFNTGVEEVDFAIEKSNGDTIGIEVKLDSTLTQKDFDNLFVMQKTLGKKFKKGIVIYTGNELSHWKDNIWAVPMCYLWER
jgi:predicted AAA+ superfamily ATPase